MTSLESTPFVVTSQSNYPSQSDTDSSTCTLESSTSDSFTAIKDGELLIEVYNRLFYKVANKHYHPHFDLEDRVQHLRLHLWSKAHLNKSNTKQQEYAWVYTLCKNALRNLYVVHNRHNPTACSIESNEDHQKDSEDKGSLDYIYRTYNLTSSFPYSQLLPPNLSPGEQEVMDQMILNNMSRRQVAQFLSITEYEVRSLRDSALCKIQRYLEATL